MQALLALIVTGLLVAFGVRWVAARLKLGAPTRMAVIVVFMLVALALYGHQLGN